MKTKLTIFQHRTWNKHNDVTGDDITKEYYAGFPEKGKPFEFETNRSDIEVHEGIMTYDKDQSEEFDLATKFDSFKGQMKFYEVGSQYEK